MNNCSDIYEQKPNLPIFFLFSLLFPVVLLEYLNLHRPFVHPGSDTKQLPDIPLACWRAETRQTPGCQRKDKQPCFDFPFLSNR
jgi:hypothetical protein